MTVWWPFAGQDGGQPPTPPMLLPPPRFAVGDRVTTRWGRATVLRVEDWPGHCGTRRYHVRHDWCDSPPGFGHSFEECDMQPHVDPPPPADADEPATPAHHPITHRPAPRAAAGQLDLFE